MLAHRRFTALYCSRARAHSWLGHNRPSEVFGAGFRGWNSMELRFHFVSSSRSFWLRLAPL